MPIFHENLSVVDGPSKLCICLEDDLFMATPAWPTPMRALISKMNLSHAPERLTDSALFNRWARRAVACIPTSSIAALLEQLRLRSSADPRGSEPPEGLADAICEVGKVVCVRANLELLGTLRSPDGHLRGDRRGTPATPCIPIRRRRAASRAPIDHMLTTFGLWVFVSTVPGRDLMSPCHDD